MLRWTLLVLLAWGGAQCVLAAHAPVWEPLLQSMATTPPAIVDNVASLRLPLYNVADLFYYFKMQVGTPPQAVRVVFDTAASDIGISTIKCDAHKFYNHSRSSTYTPDGRAATFRDGMEGEFVQDRLALLGDVAAPNQHFVEITNVSSYGQYYSVLPFDGWFGLGQNETQSVGGFPTLLRTLANLGILDRPCVHLLTPRDRNGQIVFGSGNELERGATIVPTDPHPGLWGFNVGDIKVGNTSIQAQRVAAAPSGTNPSTTSLGFAALDNTRPYVVGPPDAVRKIAELINATASPYGIFSVPCDAKLPDVSFWLDSTPPDEIFTLTTSELLGRRISETECEFKITQRLKDDTREIADWAMGAPVFHRYNFGFCWSKLPGGPPPVLTKALHG